MVKNKNKFIMSANESTTLLDSQSNISYVNESHPPADVVVYKRRWYILCVYSLLSFTQAAVWTTWSSIAEVSEVALGWSDQDVALLTNWGAITYIVSALFFAWLMDVKGLRWAGVITACLILAGTSLRCVTIHQPAANWLIHTGQILNGFAGPVAMAMPPLISAVWFPVHERVVSTAIACAFCALGVSSSFIIGPLVVPAGINKTEFDNRSIIVPPKSILKAQQDILHLMYIECGFSALVAMAVFVYFPPKPPSAPSITATTERIDFKNGLKHIVRSKGFWAFGGAYAVSTGVNNCWMAVLGVNLKSVGIDQSTSGYIAFSGIVAGSIGGVLVSVFAGIFSRRMRLFLVVLYTVGTVAFLFFTLECANYLPFHEVTLYVLIVIGNACVASAIPLLYELICEVTYPVAEGLTNTAVTWLNNLVGGIFLLVLMIPTESKMWMNWTVMGSTLVCLPVFIIYRAAYHKTDIDTGVITEHGSSVISN